MIAEGDFSRLDMPGTLITPTLFSVPSPLPHREKRETFAELAMKGGGSPLPVREGGGDGRGGSGVRAYTFGSWSFTGLAFPLRDQRLSISTKTENAIAK